MRHKKRLFIGLCSLLSFIGIGIYLNDFRIQTDSVAEKTDKGAPEFVSESQTASAQQPTGEPMPLRASSEHHKNHVGCKHPSQPKASNEQASPSSPRPSLDLPEDFLASFDRVEIGERVSIQLPGGSTAHGKLTRKRLDPNGYTLAIEGVLQTPEAGSFFFQKETLPGKAWPMVGYVLYDANEIGYRVEPHPEKIGTARIRECYADEFVCRNYAALPADALESEPLAIIPPDHPIDIPIPDYQNGVIPLQSQPDAIAVIYLDFDGAEGPHEGWVNSDFDALPGVDLSVANIFDIWRRVAEDYAPFTINVTTDLQVYLDAPENSRQRCIVTPTNTILPSAGGVAISSINSSGDIPCWAFYSVGKAAAEVISHEVGHTLGLVHDGRKFPVEQNKDNEGYYGGHGDGDVGWAPIMGASYNKNLSQWSINEYLYGSNLLKDDDGNYITTPQEDIEVITTRNNNVAFRSDDHGEIHSTASPLEIFPNDAADSSGIISTRTDVDAFAFTTSGGQIDLSIDPESSGPNLDLYAALYDDQGTLLQSSNPDTAIDATLSSTLAAGSYTVRVSGTGRGDPLADGYTDYGSQGSYKISGTVEGGSQPQRLSLAENPANNTVIGNISTNNDHGTDPLNYAITAGNDSSAFALNASSGSLTVTDPAQFNYESLSSGFDQAAEFELTVTITNATRPSLNETHRVIITVTDVNEAPVISGGSAFIPEGLRTGSSVLQATLSDPDHYDTHTWTITSGNTGGVFAINNQGLLTIANPPDYDQATDYTLQIQATDSATSPLSDTTTITVEILNVIPSGYNPGIVYRTNYLNISGGDVADLTSHANYPQHPDSEQELQSFSYKSIGDNYGTTVRAFLIAPYTGDYTFWIAGDDAGQLLLSTDSNPNNASIIASHIHWTNPLDWDSLITQESTAVTLTAGQVYYIESRHKEDGGGDHLGVAWQVMDGTTTRIAQQVIPATFLAPHTLNYSPKMADPDNVTIRENAYPGTSLATFSATDFNTSQTISYSITAGDPTGIFAINPSTGVLTLKTYNALDAQTTPTYNLTVTATDNGSPAASTTANITVNITASDLIDATGPVEEIWLNISGGNLADLYADSRWPDHPDEVSVRTDLTGLRDYGTDYGARIRAYLTPETSGTYTFYLNTDDSGALLLSTDASPANATIIASVSDWSDHLVWDKYPEQSSSPVNLVAGQPYFIEARLKEGIIADHLNVAWTGPGITDITIIPAERLSPYDSNTAPVFPNASYDFTLASDAGAQTVVGTTLATSQSFESVSHAILSGDPQTAFAINPTTGQITVQDPSAITPGQIFNLSVGAQDDGYGGLFPSKSITITATISVSGTQFQLWKGQHFGINVGNAQLSGNLMDPDGDSINNLIEYALNLDPNRKDAASNLPTVSNESSILKFTYRKNLSATDLTYHIQQATDLNATTPWSAAQITNEETLSDDGSTRLIRATLSNPAPAPRRFIRLQVEID